MNGVPHAPRLSRPASLGPLPEVVGKYVDPQGVEWWCADGSTTTSGFTDVDYAGTLRRDVVTEHNAAVDTRSALPPPDGEDSPR